MAFHQLVVPSYLLLPAILDSHQSVVSGPSLGIPDSPAASCKENPVTAQRCEADGLNQSVDLFLDVKKINLVVCVMLYVFLC